MQYFGNMGHKSWALDAFAAELMKVTSYYELWDAKLTWYSLITTHQISLWGLKNDFVIHGF